MGEMSVEKRRMDQWFRVKWPVSVLTADGARIGETEDISWGGAFIRCEKPPPPDEKVLLSFEKTSSEAKFVLAKVAWTNLESQGSSDKPIGMGIQFLQFLRTPRSRTKIRD
jgi:hypothetical protein